MSYQKHVICHWNSIKTFRTIFRILMEMPHPKWCSLIGFIFELLINVHFMHSQMNAKSPRSLDADDMNVNIVNFNVYVFSFPQNIHQLLLHIHLSLVVIIIGRFRVEHISLTLLKDYSCSVFHTNGTSAFSRLLIGAVTVDISGVYCDE